MSSNQPVLTTIQLQSFPPSGNSGQLDPASQSAQRHTPPPSPANSLPPQLPPLNFSNTALVASSTQLSHNAASPQPSLALTHRNSANTLGLSQETLKGLRTVWKDLCTTTNVLAIMGLVIGFTFGVAATKQTNVQSAQGTKSYELDLWNTCADHEAIQNTTTCKRVLSQSFDRFQKRGLKGIDPDIASRLQEIINKRDALDGPVDGLYDTPIERWLSKLAITDAELRLIFARNKRGIDFPEIRALVFPLAEMLYIPIKWTFSLIEAILISVIYTIRTLFRWTGVIFWFMFQITLYGIVEQMVKSALNTVDALILVVVPRWMPQVIVSGMGTAIGIAALKSYWYGISFWECVKWYFVARIGFWAICVVIGGGFGLYSEWRARIKRQH